jgi:hypothetical protein
LSGTKKDVAAMKSRGQRSGLNYLKEHATSFEFVVLRKTTPLAVNKPYTIIESKLKLA